MIEVHFDKAIYKGTTDVYVFERKAKGRVRYEIKITSQEVESHFAMEPSLELPFYAEELDPFIKALIEGLERGHYLRKTSATEAELTATKYHLEDFRKLVFEDKNKP